METIPEALVIVFPIDIVLSNADRRTGPRCEQVGVKAGAYYVERVKNPLNPKLAPWIVLMGTKIGMIEHVLLRTEVNHVPIRSPVMLIGSDQYAAMCKSDPKLSGEVLTFDAGTMSKKPKKKPRSYSGQPDSKPAENEVFI